jgi:hypothetical protein
VASAMVCVRVCVCVYDDDDDECNDDDNRTLHNTPRSAM